MKTPIFFFALIYMLAIQVACKEDCEDPRIELRQDYKIYQNWYPYKELDTLHFFRPIENDTIVFYGGKYNYPTYEKTSGCDCCPTPVHEYLQQTFRDTVNKYDLRVEMDGINITFTLFNQYEYLYDFGGHALLKSVVTTPDSVYEWAYQLDYSGHTCYYASRVGIVKYTYENNGSWLFLRKR